MAGSSNNADEPITDINLTPLVDVSLVLVIIFMAVAPFAITAGIKVLQSKASAQVGKVSLSESVQVRLSKEGKLTLNGTEILRENYAAEVTRALIKSEDKFVIVKADTDNRVGQVVSLLDEAKQSGALKMALMKN
jgi:biopolymer transport protein ExbD